MTAGMNRSLIGLVSTYRGAVGIVHLIQFVFFVVKWHVDAIAQVWVGAQIFALKKQQDIPEGQSFLFVLLPVLSHEVLHL